MTVCLLGVVLTVDGLSQSIESRTLRTRSWAAAGLDARSTQAPRIAVNVGHDDNAELGEVVSLHRTREGAVWALAVCDADGANRLAAFAAPLYFSPKTWRNRDDGTDITIEHVAITEAPATVSIPPVEIYAGGVERAGNWLHRGKVLNGVRAELVEQARERSRFRNRNSPLRVGGHDPDDYGPPPLSSYQRMKMGDWRSLPGGLQKSAHRGRIISVR